MPVLSATDNLGKVMELSIYHCSKSNLCVVTVVYVGFANKEDMSII